MITRKKIEHEINVLIDYRNEEAKRNPIYDMYNEGFVNELENLKKKLVGGTFRREVDNK